MPCNCKALSTLNLFKLRNLRFFFFTHTKETDLFFFVPAGYKYAGGTLGMHSIMVIELKSRDAGGFERRRFRSMNTDLHMLSAHGRPS